MLQFTFFQFLLEFLCPEVIMKLKNYSPKSNKDHTVVKKNYRIPSGQETIT
jgi:hypothetical protein